jgi:AraC-like DNA-binding protein
MNTATLAKPVKIWHAPDVMDAVMLKGRFVDHRYPPHAHDTHCLAVITGGTLAVEVQHQRRLCRRGEVIVIDAEVVHAGWAPDNGQWKMRVAHIQPAALAAYSERLGMPRRERFDVRSPFISDLELSQLLYGVNWCSEMDHDRFKRSETVARAIIALHARHASSLADLPKVRREPALVNAIKARLRDDLQTRLTLPMLADEFDVTPFVLLRAFTRDAGLSPHAFQQQERVRNALPLLRGGKSIAEVSTCTGFADQSHFTRVFKQQTGVTPGAYQAAFL